MKKKLLLIVAKIAGVVLFFVLACVFLAELLLAAILTAPIAFYQGRKEHKKFPEKHKEVMALYSAKSSQLKAKVFA